MSVLEDKIRKNSEHYNVHEPADGHFDRFASRLDREFHAKGQKSFRINWRAAAAVILFAGLAGLLLFQYSGQNSNVQAREMSDELTRVVDHYNLLTDQKLNDISDCAASDEEAEKINELARLQLAELEKDAAVLQEELVKDESNDRVYGALVTNYRTRIKILDNIITKICQL